MSSEEIQEHEEYYKHEDREEYERNKRQKNGMLYIRRDRISRLEHDKLRVIEKHLSFFLCEFP